MTGEIGQMLQTAREQHERGELSIFELQTLYSNYGQTGFIIDGDRLEGRADG